jgi:hypothetical protein
MLTCKHGNQLAYSFVLMLLCACPSLAQTDSLPLPAYHDLQSLIDVPPESEYIDPQLVDIIEQEQLDAGPGRARGRDFALALRSRISQEDEVRRGYISGAYSGSRLASYSRAMVDIHGTWHAGVLIDRDAGESSLTDRLGWYVQYTGTGLLRSAVLGDYTVSSGQGIVFWKSAARSKGIDASSVARHESHRLRPYLSPTVNACMKGAAVQIGSEKWEMTVFTAFSALDASTDTIGGGLGSLNASGLHRTASESAHSGAGREQVTGISSLVRFRHGLLDAALGVDAAWFKWNRTIKTSGPVPARLCNLGIAGLNADLVAGSARLFGELGRNTSGAMAGIIGLSASSGPACTASLLYRCYARGFTSPRGFAFGEDNGATSNETGVYLGIKVRPFRKLRLSAYMDRFRFPGGRPSIPVPSSGTDMMLAAEWTPAPRFSIAARVSHALKDKALGIVDSSGRNVHAIVARRQWRFRLDCTYDDRRNCMARFRIEWAEAAFVTLPNHYDGIALSADVRVVLTPEITLKCGLANFSTDSYESRISRIESDVRGLTGLSILSGKGVRMHAMTTWSPMTGLILTIKYGRTIMDGVRSIGSGQDEVRSDAIGMWTLQIDWTL